MVSDRAAYPMEGSREGGGRSTPSHIQVEGELAVKGSERKAGP